MTSRTKPAIIPLANLPSDWLCLVSRAQVCSPAPSKVGLRWQGLDIVVQGPDCEKVQSRYAMQMPAIFSSVGGPSTLGRARPSFNFGSLSSGVFRHEGTNDNDRNDDDDDDGEVVDDD